MIPAPPEVPAVPVNAVLAAYSDQLPFVDVESSNLAAVGYLPDFARLFVKFHKGGVVTAEWAYDGVPRAVYDALLSAPSKGKYFAANIRNNYAQRRVR
jgi:hypothetical protein